MNTVGSQVTGSPVPKHLDRDGVREKSCFALDRTLVFNRKVLLGVNILWLVGNHESNFIIKNSAFE